MAPPGQKTPEVREISCPQCGSPIALRNPRTKTVVCESCGAQLDLSGGEFSFLGFAHRDEIQSPLKVGMVGTSRSKRWTIVGHMRLRGDDAYYWDEYLLLSDSGEIRWVQYDDDEFALFIPRAITEGIDTAPTDALQIDGRAHHIIERGSAEIIYLAGELTWKAKLGDRIQFIDTGKVGVEWTETEIELFDVAPMTKGHVKEIFGLTEWQLASGCYVLDFDDYEDEEDDWGEDFGDDPEVTTASVIFWALIFLMAVIFVMADECDSGSGYSRGYGGYSSFGK